VSPYLAVVALPLVCAAVTVYAVAGRPPTLPAPTVTIAHDNVPLINRGFRTVAE
jgi:hypothetical protein